MGSKSIFTIYFGDLVITQDGFGSVSVGVYRGAAVCCFCVSGHCGVSA